MITVVRDPFDLHRSIFFYVQRLHKQQGVEAKRNRKIHPIIEKGWTLEDYLRNVKYSYISIFFALGINLDNYERILSSQYIHIGVAEDLQGSVDALSELLGFESIIVPQMNVSKRNESVPSSAREEFEANNPLEVAIYKYALKNYKGSSQGSSIVPPISNALDHAAGGISRNAAILAKNEEIFFYKDILKQNMKNKEPLLGIKSGFIPWIGRVAAYPARFLKRFFNKNG